MILSKRLQAVATLVDIGVKVIDVGCDHALLDIYLTLNNDNKCIASDINNNALDMAKKNIDKYNLNSKIEIRLTDGLKGIDVEDTDNIVISGMGTHTILEILKSHKLSNTLIISSNNDIELLRREIVNMGYYIDSEIFIIDHGKSYIIIKFMKGGNEYKEKDYILGPILKNNVEYRKYLIKQQEKILKKIPKKKIFIRLKYKINIFKLKMNI